MLDMCVFFHKPQTRPTLQLAKACLEESCFSLISQRVTSHATQGLINSVRGSTSSVPASHLKCLGCSPELLLLHNITQAPGFSSSPSPCPTACLHVTNAIVWTFQLLALPFPEVIRAPQHSLYWCGFVFISPTILNTLKMVLCWDREGM